MVSIKIDEDLLRRVDEAAREQGISRSELFRRAVRLWLEERGGRPKPFVTRRIIIY